MAAPLTTVIFDLDGTIIDSENYIRDLSRPIISRHLAREASDSEMNSLKGKPWKQIFRTWFGEKGINVHNEIVEKYEEMSAKLKPYPGVEDMISGLHDLKVELAVVSSKLTRQIHDELHANDLAGFFTTVIGQDDTDKHKPHPEPLLLACRKMGVSPQRCIYIGDQEWDMVASRSAGMLSGGALWGEGISEVLASSGADYLFESPKEVISKLGDIIHSRVRSP